MDTLKKLKVIELKQILRDNALRVGGNKSELIDRILANNIIYENDIKTSPVYIQKGMTATTKQTVPELKALLKSYGLKVSGRKAELLKRLSNVGKKISNIKPYEKMLVADLKKILNKFKLSVKGLKADLVARLYDYDRSREELEMGMEDNMAKIKRAEDKLSRANERYNEYKEIEKMNMEDITESEGIAVADAFFPIQRDYDIPTAIEIDNLYSPAYYNATSRHGSKYDPEYVQDMMRRDRQEEIGYNEITDNILITTLPRQVVQQHIDNRPPYDYTLSFNTDLRVSPDFRGNISRSVLQDYRFRGWESFVLDRDDNGYLQVIYRRSITKKELLRYVDIDLIHRILNKDKKSDEIQFIIPELKTVSYPNFKIVLKEFNIMDKRGKNPVWYLIAHTNNRGHVSITATRFSSMANPSGIEKVYVIRDKIPILY